MYLGRGITPKIMSYGKSKEERGCCAFITEGEEGNRNILKEEKKGRVQR